jgi:hypothetical protein
MDIRSKSPMIFTTEEILKNWAFEWSSNVWESVHIREFVNKNFEWKDNNGWNR